MTSFAFPQCGLSTVIEEPVHLQPNPSQLLDFMKFGIQVITDNNEGIFVDVGFGLLVVQHDGLGLQVLLKSDLVVLVFGRESRSGCELVVVLGPPGDTI